MDHARIWGLPAVGLLFMLSFVAFGTSVPATGGQLCHLPHQADFVMTSPALPAGLR